MRGGRRQGAGRKGVNGYRAVCATLPRELWEALENTRKPGETTADTVRRHLAACLIANESWGPTGSEGQAASGKAEISRIALPVPARKGAKKCET
jgi:hypothetical protein